MPTTEGGINYEEHGDGPLTMLMLPGLGCSVKCWTEVIPLLDGYRIITMDLPGHAGSVDSEADGTNLSTLARPLIAACDELGLTRVAIVGLSLGGALGVRIALNRPDLVRGVMALFPWNAGGTSAGDPVIEGFYGAYGNVEAIAAGIEKISLDPSKTTDVVETMQTIPEQLWRGWFGGGAYTSMFDELAEISVPACYVLGGKDNIAPQEQLIDDVRQMPGGRLIFLSDVGHLAPYEAPDTIAEEIREYIERRVA